MRKFLHQFFLPHELNNFRPKLLHYRFLTIIILFFLVAQIGLARAKTTFPTVLGATTDISAQKLLELTNIQRQQHGLQSLVINNKLNDAAKAKGEYMFAKNFWAHNAPDGKTPWSFIRSAQYEYVYAGENLARGFTNSDSVIQAWMDSPTHRENMLSQNYRDIGFAVSEGTLLGEHTTLVVEMFGNTQAVPLARQSGNTSPEAVPQQAGQQTLAMQVPILVSNKPIVDVGLVSWYIGIGTVSLFLFVLFVDMVIIDRRKIVRFVGHNIDHIVFLSLLLLFIIISNKGIVI